MKRQHLATMLSRLRPLPAPRLNLEQYPLSGEVAATVLHLAGLRGDLAGSVLDLGCGNGVLAIGAALLGARPVAGVDIDLAALRVARENASAAGVPVSWVRADVLRLQGRARTVVTNPPFGAQRRGADRPFLDAAVRLADVAYTVHNAGSRDFVEAYLAGRGEATDAWKVPLPLKAVFPHHRREVEYINVEVYRVCATRERE